MSKADRILAKMKLNPHDWRIENVKTVAQTYGIEWRQKKALFMWFLLEVMEKHYQYLHIVQLSQFI